MALCTKCGAIWNDNDLMKNPDKHWCDPLDVPNKGEEIGSDGKRYDIVTGKEIL